MLENPSEARDSLAEENAAGYFNTKQGFWDRLQFISVDDGLNNLTDQGRQFGLLPITASIANAVPHIFWPNKPVYNFGNLYAHEIGGLPDEDTSTGISFSPTAEAYHMMGWKGIFVVAPLVWLAMFIVFDSLFGDLRATPWGLLVIAQISHTAPEGCAIRMHRPDDPWIGSLCLLRIVCYLGGTLCRPRRAWPGSPEDCSKELISTGAQPSHRSMSRAWLRPSSYPISSVTICFLLGLYRLSLRKCFSNKW